MCPPPFSAPSYATALYYAYYINAIYPLVVAALVHVICHSTCLEMHRIAQICTYYRTKFSGEGPQTPFQYNYRDIEIEHNYTVFLKCIILINISLNTLSCAFTPLVLLLHIKQKLKCTSVIMHSPSYLSIRRLSLHPFESHSFCRPSRICIFDFLSRTA